MSAFVTYPGPGVTSYLNFASFPTVAPDGALALARDTDVLYAYNAGTVSWVQISGPVTGALTIGAIDGAATSANGLRLVADVLYTQSASDTVPGMVNLAAQSFAGAKTFEDPVSILERVKIGEGSDPSYVPTNAVIISTAAGTDDAGYSLNVEGNQDTVSALFGAYGGAGIDYAYLGTDSTHTLGLYTDGVTRLNIREDGQSLFATNTIPSGVFPTPTNSVLSVLVYNAESLDAFVVVDDNETVKLTITKDGVITANNLSGTNTGDAAIAAFGSSPTADGATISGQAITLQPADSTHPGLVTAGTQTIGGAKTCAASLTLQAGFTRANRTISSNFTIDSVTPDDILFVDTSGATVSLTLPAPAAGRTFMLVDSTNSFATNNLTLVRHGSEKINSLAASKVFRGGGPVWTITTDGTDWYL